jgi:hypothetical protein
MPSGRSTLLLLAFAFAWGLGSCRSLESSGPEDPVTVRVESMPVLGSFEGEAFRRDVCFYFVSDPSAFFAAELNELAFRTEDVPGGVGVRRTVIAPGTTSVQSLGAPGSEEYRYVGVVVPHPDPARSYREIVRIPAHGRMRLEILLGGSRHDRMHAAFGEDTR